MISEIVSYLKFGNRFYAVEQTQLNGNNQYYGIILKKTKKELDIESNFNTQTIEELKTRIPKNKPIVLVINTDSILTKQVTSKNNDSLKLVHVAFPNIKVEDFYYEVLTQDENHFVSICRKSYVNELLDNYTSNNLTVLDFTLGNLISSSISNFIESDKIQSSNASISITEGSIIDIKTEVISSEATYKINGLDITNNQLLSFAAALNFVIKSQNLQSSFDDTKKKLSDTFKQKQFANQFLKTSLLSLFIILLVNFLFFNHYYNKVNSLRETALLLEASKTKMISLNEKVQRTEKMAKDILKTSSSKSSFYVNTLINNLPESILLQELNYQPLLKKIKEDKVIESDKNTILITGQTNKSILFSQWVSKLEASNWVSSVDILNFEDLSKSSSTFTVKINTKDDTKN